MAVLSHVTVLNGSGDCFKRAWKSGDCLKRVRGHGEQRAWESGERVEGPESQVTMVEPDCLIGPGS